MPPYAARQPRLMSASASSPSLTTVLCPDCGQSPPISHQHVSDPEISELACKHCESRFRSYRGVLDLRTASNESCWSSAIVSNETQLVEQMVDRFDRVSLDQMVDWYANAHALPARIMDGMREYLRNAEQREAWTIRYMDFCTGR